jgi:flavin reductase (DIM6/NTAB) family NADH-FMN oxidoreductase RutF
MYLNIAEMRPVAVYQALIQSVIPRPIAWVLSKNLGAGYNLAPFSYFTAVCESPPMVVISVGMKPGGGGKDTWVNIETNEDYVIHIAHPALRAQMIESSRTLPAGESELTTTALATVPFEGFSMPRLTDARLALACQRRSITEIGNGPHALILGEVKAIYVHDELATEDAKGRFKIDPAKVDPVSRLGANDYGSLSEVSEIVRPP